jgi:hypothetical protein
MSPRGNEGSLAGRSTNYDLSASELLAALRLEHGEKHASLRDALVEKAALWREPPTR